MSSSVALSKERRERERERERKWEERRGRDMNGQGEKEFGRDGLMPEWKCCHLAWPGPGHSFRRWTWDDPGSAGVKMIRTMILMMMIMSYHHNSYGDDHIHFFKKRKIWCNSNYDDFRQNEREKRGRRASPIMFAGGTIWSTCWLSCWYNNMVTMVVACLQYRFVSSVSSSLCFDAPYKETRSRGKHATF